MKLLRTKDQNSQICDLKFYLSVAIPGSGAHDHGHQTPSPPSSSHPPCPDYGAKANIIHPTMLLSTEWFFPHVLFIAFLKAVLSSSILPNLHDIEVSFISERSSSQSCLTVWPNVGPTSISSTINAVGLRNNSISFGLYQPFYCLPRVLMNFSSRSHFFTLFWTIYSITNQKVKVPLIM